MAILQKDNYHGAIHDPMRKYMKMFPAINEKVKTHERLALDHVKVRRLTLGPSPWPDLLQCLPSLAVMTTVLLVLLVTLSVPDIP